LQEMGNPQQGMTYVHVAGTNGKGSTSLIIAEVLSRAGYRVGRFSSPHLHSYSERFTIDGRDIGEEVFQAILDGVEKHIQVMLSRGESHPTEFEVLTAVALQYFKNENVDLAVLEVGMGGSFDSTNVIIPLISVITGVDYDHTAFLGNSLEEIAANKSGIIKSGVPVIVGSMDKAALRVIAERAREMGADLHFSSEVQVSRIGIPALADQIINIESAAMTLSGIKFALLGNYQLSNLATAFTALNLIGKQGYRVDESSIRDSLAGLKIPVRLEILKCNPLVIADAAHNPQAARALKESLDTLLPGRSKVLVLGLVDDKDRDGILVPLGANTRATVVCRPKGLRGETWQEVTKRWRLIFPDIQVEEQESIAMAVARGMKLMEKDDYLLITGSFYVLDQACRIFNDN